MPRKLRLSVHRKNEFRKKRAIQLQKSLNSSEGNLFRDVSIPRKSMSATSIESLKERVQESVLLPNGTLMLLLNTGLALSTVI